MTPTSGAHLYCFFILLPLVAGNIYDDIQLQDEELTLTDDTSTYKDLYNALNTYNEQQLQDIHEKYAYNNYDENEYNNALDENENEMDDRIRNRLIAGYLKLRKRRHRRRRRGRKRGRRGRIRKRRRRRGRRGRRGTRFRRRRRRGRGKRGRRMRRLRRRRRRRKYMRLGKRYRKFMRFNSAYKRWYKTYFAKWYAKNIAVGGRRRHRLPRGRVSSAIGMSLRDAIRQFRGGMPSGLEVPRKYNGPKVDFAVNKIAKAVAKRTAKRNKVEKKMFKKKEKRKKKGGNEMYAKLDDNGQ